MSGQHAAGDAREAPASGVARLQAAAAAACGEPPTGHWRGVNGNAKASADFAFHRAGHDPAAGTPTRLSTVMGM